MKNLKRVLALTLVVAMMFTLAISAGAATFSDDKDISYADAVAVLVELGIIKGYPDGSYKPADTVTRAEMAKMITVILNKGVDNPALYTSGVTDLNDIGGHWAEGYIKYCYTLGIIAGYGDGTFRPDATVTGTEAVKMILVALGYDVEQEGLTGVNWDIKANALATQAGIFDDVVEAPSVGASRDMCAALLFNMLNAKTVQYNVNYFTGISTLLKNDTTALYDYFGVITVKGIIVANEFADITYETKSTTDTSVTPNVTTTTTTNSSAALPAGNTEVKVTEVSGAATAPASYKISTGEENLGKLHTIFYNPTTKKVIGKPIVDSAVVSTTTEESKGVEDVAKGVGLKVDSKTEYYTNYDLDKSHGGDVRGYVTTVISNNQDGKVDYVFYVVPTLTQISKVEAGGGNPGITFKNMNLDDGGSAKGVSYDNIVADNVDSFAKNDLVLVTAIDGTYFVQKAETVTGKVTSKNTSAKNVVIDGTTYDSSWIPVAASLITGADPDYSVLRETARDVNGVMDITVKKNYTLVKDSFGNAVVYKGNSDTVTYGLLTGNTRQSGFDVVYDIRILAADGTILTGEAGTKVSTINLDPIYGRDYSQNPELVVYDGFNLTEAISDSGTYGDPKLGYRTNSGEVNVNLSTGVDYKKGDTKIVAGSATLTLDSSTKAFFAVTNTDNSTISYYAYQGRANIPAFKVPSSLTDNKLYADDNDGDGIVDAIYVYLDENDFGEGAKDFTLLFEPGSDDGEYQAFNAVTITDKGVVTLKEGSIQVKNTATKNTFYHLTEKTDGKYTPTTEIKPLSASTTGAYTLSGLAYISGRMLTVLGKEFPYQGVATYKQDGPNMVTTDLVAGDTVTVLVNKDGDAIFILVDKEGDGKNPAVTPTIASVTSNQASGGFVVGDEVVLTAAASVTDGGTLTYQWSKGSSAIAGATSATYTIASMTAADAGTYTVTVTNTLNGTTATNSGNVTLTQAVSAAPVITTQPTDASTSGGTATLTVIATGTTGSALTYQWKADGAEMSGETNATLSVTRSDTTDDAIDYEVVVTNTEAGKVATSVTSDTVNVTYGS